MVLQVNGYWTEWSAIWSVSDRTGAQRDYRRGVNRGMQIRRSVMIYWPNPPLNFRPQSEIGAKIFVLHAKSKIRAQKIDESAFRCSCRIRKSVKITLWIRNPGKIFAKPADPFAYSPPSSYTLCSSFSLHKSKRHLVYWNRLCRCRHAGKIKGSRDFPIT